MQPEITESTWFYEFLAWLELNKQRVIWGSVAVLALIVVVYVYRWHIQQTEVDANRALFAIRPSATPEGSTLVPVGDLLKVAQEYPSTSAGERALLLAAGNLYAEGRYAEAQTRFEEFRKQHAGSLLAPVAALGVASSLDALDKMDEALGAYQGIVNQYPTESVAARAQLAMGAIYESKNQPDQAFRVYDELSRLAGAGQAAMQAAMHKELLLQQYPKLAVTNASAIATTVVKPAPAPTNAPPQAATNAAPAAQPATP
ncbi:MAG TPA: tetratricopeptide repeat protein [Verrucomicrobiota bacterium]|nr:tetratricopeptide repeat protein [Verrucomicrobiota bacterium]HNU50279.1 tetratricopeptide repeat protein [Verrucomicrobiota bacterium]